MAYQHEVDVLTKLASYSKQSLQRGFVLREQMHQAIEAGIEPDTYRVKFLKESVVRIFALLEKLAVEFNQEHIGDRYSSLDLADCLTSALSTLQAQDKD